MSSAETPGTQCDIYDRTLECRRLFAKCEGISELDEQDWLDDRQADFNCPYICVFENCQTPDQLYVTSDEWRAHMRKSHSVIRWACCDCRAGPVSEDDYTFNTALEWESHVRGHGVLTSSSRLPVLSKLSEQLSIPPASCPLCRNPEGPLSLEEDDHIAGHLHSFALRSLPWVETGDGLQTISGHASVVSRDYLAETDSDTDGHVGGRIIIDSHTKEDIKLLVDDCLQLLRNSEDPEQNTLLTRLEQAVRDMNTMSSISEAQKDIFFSCITRLHIRLVKSPGTLSQEILLEAFEDIAPISGTDWLDADFKVFSMPPVMTSTDNERKSMDSHQIEGPSPDALKIIVGIDFGSQYTGVSYAWYRESHDIIEITQWPAVGSQVIQAPKVPTQIAYETDETGMVTKSWGYLIQRGVPRYSWMSLLLDKNARVKELDDLGLHKVVQEIEGQLPPGKSVEVLTEDFLRELYNFIISSLQNEYSEPVINLTPINFWLTIPAIFSYKAQIKTLRAANKAFRLRDRDKLSVISDAEASALAILIDDLSKTNVRAGGNHRRTHAFRPVAIRLLTIQAIKDLNSISPSKLAPGFHEVNRLLRQVEQLKSPNEPPIALYEMISIFDTEGSSQNGGGSFIIKEDGSGSCYVKFEQDSTGFVPGAIGSPVPAEISSLLQRVKTDKSSIIHQKKSYDEFLVCSCEDSTVECMAYRVFNDDPWELEEIEVGEGGKFGAITLEHNLRQLASREYGEKFDSLPLSLTGSSSPMMKAFKWNTQIFGRPGARLKKLPVSMDVLDFAGYNQLHGEIILTEDDMKAIFDPVIGRIIKLIDKQVQRRHRSSQGRNKPTLFLVGELGDSPYLRSEINAWCMKNSIHMNGPVYKYRQAARGAVVRGLDLATVSRRLSRLHYGMQLAIPYKRGEHGRRDDSYSDPFTGTTHVPGYMFWSIIRGTVFSAHGSQSISFSHVLTDEKRAVTIDIMSCSLEEAPKWYNENEVERMATIKADLSEIDYSRFDKKLIDGTVQYRVIVNLEVILGHKQGTVGFQLRVFDQLVGQISIDVD